MRAEHQNYETWTFEEWESLPLTNDDLMYQVLDSVTSALASSSLQDMEEDDPVAFFDSLAGACDAVHDVQR
jgi:hypothetical protein